MVSFYLVCVSKAEYWSDSKSRGIIPVSGYFKPFFKYRALSVTDEGEQRAIKYTAIN